MTYRTLREDRANQVALIRLSPQSKTDAVRLRLADELADVCDRIAEDEEVRVVVLTGSGPQAFSWTTDPAPPTPSEDGGEGSALRSVVDPVAELELPVIGAVRGDARGLGLEILLACDLRIASEDASFGLPQVRQGVLPCDGGTQRLPRLIGRGKALELILTAEPIDAREALRIGLVNRVVPERRLTTVVMNMAREMAKQGPIALRLAKEAVHKGLDMTLAQGLRLEADLYGLIQTTGDRREGITAFRQKRPPRFEGR